MQTEQKSSGLFVQPQETLLHKGRAAQNLPNFFLDALKELPLLVP